MIYSFEFMLAEIKRILRTGKGSLRLRRISVFLHLSLWPILLIPRIFWPRRRFKTLPASPRILLIRIDGIGDLTMSTPSLEALRQKFPDAQIDLLTSDAAQSIGQMIAAAGVINEVFTMRITGRTFAMYREMAAGLRARKYDVAIDLRGDPRNLLLIWFAGAPIRLGLAGSGLNYLLSGSIELRPGHHQADEPAAIFKRLGVEHINKAPHLTIGPDVFAAADIWLAERGAAKNRPLCAIHLSAFQPSKIWPLERFINTAHRLQQQMDAQILIVGGPSDMEISREFSRRFTEPPIVAAGELSLPATAAALARCSVMIGNDSGPAHIAAAVGCPVVVIFGNGNPAIFAPRSAQAIMLRSPAACDPRCNQQCARPATRCMLDVSVEEVVSAAKSLMRRPPATA